MVEGSTLRIPLGLRFSFTRGKIFSAKTYLKGKLIVEVCFSKVSSWAKDSFTFSILSAVSVTTKVLVFLFTSREPSLERRALTDGATSSAKAYLKEKLLTRRGTLTLLTLMTLSTTSYRQPWVSKMKFKISDSDVGFSKRAVTFPFTSGETTMFTPALAERIRNTSGRSTSLNSIEMGFKFSKGILAQNELFTAKY